MDMIEEIEELFNDDGEEMVINHYLLLRTRVQQIVAEAAVPLPLDLIANQRRRPTRNKNYFEVTIPRYSLDEFKSHFRMSRASFQVSTKYIDTLEYIELSVICNLFSDITTRGENEDKGGTASY